jgi:radical SAM-linked protein
MHRYRMLFSKTGRIKYISHLDLMRTLQRTFMRARCPLSYSQGFNPHPIFSIALPLSVGVESLCEILSFSTEETLDVDSLPEVLSKYMPEGLQAREIYESENNIGDLKWVAIQGRLFYDKKDSILETSALLSLFSDPQRELVVEKKGKKGISEFSLWQGMQRIEFSPDDGTVLVKMRVSAQNPTFNPYFLTAAVKKYCPDAEPDFAKFIRTEIFDSQGNIFR